MHLAKVDFPAPLFPIIAITFAAGKVREGTCKALSFFVYEKKKFEKSILSSLFMFFTGNGNKFSSKGRSPISICSDIDNFSISALVYSFCICPSSIYITRSKRPLK